MATAVNSRFVNSWCLFSRCFFCDRCRCASGLNGFIGGFAAFVNRCGGLFCLAAKVRVAPMVRFNVGLGGRYFGVATNLCHAVAASELNLARLGLGAAGTARHNLGTIYSKNACEAQSPLSASFIQYCATLVLTLLMVVIKGESAAEWHPDFILALGWSVLVLSVGAILLLLVMINAGESTRTASYFYLVPPLTALEAWLLFDEQMTGLALMGMVITVFGVYWANRAVKGKGNS